MKRRTFMASVGAISIVAFAGCGSRTKGLNEHLDDGATVNARLSEGDSIGARYGDEQWRFTVIQIHDDNSIDLTIEKVLLDETGQNKEGTDASLTFERSEVNVGEIVKVENDLRIWYIEYDDTAWIAVGDEYLETCKADEYCSTDN